MWPNLPSSLCAFVVSKPLTAKRFISSFTPEQYKHWVIIYSFTFYGDRTRNIFAHSRTEGKIMPNFNMLSHYLFFYLYNESYHPPSFKLLFPRCHPPHKSLASLLANFTFSSVHCLALPSKDSIRNN